MIYGHCTVIFFKEKRAEMWSVEKECMNVEKDHLFNAQLEEKTDPVLSCLCDFQDRNRMKYHIDN